MISNNGLVAIKKMEGDTYITITEKGEDVSTKLLQELIAYEEFANMNRKTDIDDEFIAKGTKSEDPSDDPSMNKVQEKLAAKISEINEPFQDQLKTIEDEPNTLED